MPNFVIGSGSSYYFTQKFVARIETGVCMIAINIAIIKGLCWWRFFALRSDQLNNRFDVFLVEIPAIQTECIK